jgi:hypothetical protein
MAVHVENIGNEVYVYMNGSLLYKKWKNNQQSSVIFANNPSWTYDKNTLVSISDWGIRNNITGEVKDLK